MAADLDEHVKVGGELSIPASSSDAGLDEVPHEISPDALDDVDDPDVEEYIRIQKAKDVLLSERVLLCSVVLLASTLTYQWSNAPDGGEETVVAR